MKNHVVGGNVEGVATVKMPGDVRFLVMGFVEDSIHGFVEEESPTTTIK